MKTKNSEVVFPEIFGPCRGCGQTIDLAVNKDGLCTMGLKNGKGCFNLFSEYVRTHYPDTRATLYFQGKDWDLIIKEWNEKKQFYAKTEPVSVEDLEKALLTVEQEAVASLQQMVPLLVKDVISAVASDILYDIRNRKK